MVRTIFIVLLTVALWCSAGAQNLISTERAIGSALAFCGDPSSVVTSSRLTYDRFRLFDYCYDVHVDRGAIQEDYTVGAEDGIVYSAVFTGPESPAPPTLTPEQARGIAEGYLGAHYPLFAARTYQISLPKYWLPPQHGAYTFQWRQILNKYGTTAPWWVAVMVDGGTGRVITYAIPPESILAPTIPQVTRTQAELAAAQFTPYDPTAVPFDEEYLSVTEDALGVQRLRWLLCQNRRPLDPENPTPIWEVTVDAITGAVVGAAGPLAGAPPPRSSAHRVVGDPRFSVRLGGGRPLACAVPPVVDKGLLWVRVEMLRGLGAHVHTSAEGFGIATAHGHITPTETGARRHDYGWWIPLRKTAAALGWRVDWLPLTKEGVIHSGYVPPAFGR